MREQWINSIRVAASQPGTRTELNQWINLVVPLKHTKNFTNKDSNSSQSVTISWISTVMHQRNPTNCPQLVYNQTLPTLYTHENGYKRFEIQMGNSKFDQNSTIGSGHGNYFIEHVAHRGFILIYIFGQCSTWPRPIASSEDKKIRW